MRRLMIFSLSFAGATAAYLWLLPSGSALWLAFSALVLAAGLMFFRAEHARRVRIAALGAAVALLWCLGYAHFCIAPRRALCGEDRLLTAELIASPESTPHGCRVLARIAGERIMIYLDETYASAEIGDRLTFRAQIVDVSDGGETGNLYFPSLDISLLAFQEGDVQREKASSVTLRMLPALAAKAMREKISALFPADTEGFLRALLMGDRSGLSYELENQMSVTGISHIVSVSGMHVSLIVGAVMLLCQRRRRLAAGVSIVVMAFFAAMLDFSPSVTRAVLMNTVLLLAPILRRENDAPTSLSAASLVILLGNPWALASLSLQLSFGAMAGMLLLSPRICDWLLGVFDYARWRSRAPLLAGLLRTAAVSLATSLGAMIFTTPRVAAVFETVSLIAPLSNLLTMQLLSWCFTFGFGAVLLGFVFSPVGSAVAWALSWAVRFVLWIVDGLSRVPYAAVYTDRFYIAAWLIAAYLMLGIFFLRRGRRPAVLLGSLAVTLAGAVLFCSFHTADWRVTVLDVGQGQCILMECGATRVAVDCGGSDAEETGEALARKLLMSGTERLDALVLTHFDTDHVGGVEQLLSRVEVGEIFAPDHEDDSGNRGRIERAAAEAEVPLTCVHGELWLEFSGGSIGLFAPAYAFSDNDGLAALMSLEECDILITGDMDVDAERALMRAHALPDLEVLIAGHHGSKNATGAELLEQTRPETVVISVGKNAYGHPAQAVLDRIAAVGAEVCRTDLDGEIIILR